MQYRLKEERIFTTQTIRSRGSTRETIIRTFYTEISRWLFPEPIQTSRITRRCTSLMEVPILARSAVIVSRIRTRQTIGVTGCTQSRGGASIGHCR